MYFKANLRKFLIPLVEFLFLYAALIAVTTLGSHEWSARHTIFLAIDALIFLLGRKLFLGRKAYPLALGFLLLVLSSVFLLRHWTPTVLRVWDVNTYISFVFALVNIMLLLIALPKHLYIKRALAFIFSVALYLPLLALWGYYFSEHAW